MTIALEAKHVNMAFGTYSVLKDLNLTVIQGEIYGFIGHNGAGKSTTMQLFMGLLTPQSGSLSIGGGEAGDAGEVGASHQGRNAGASHQRAGYLPEEPRFFPYMSAIQYLTYIGTMGGQPKGQMKQRIEYLLNLVDLEKKAHRPVGTYSRGMKQRLGMAVALYHDPQVLLLDEPSSALDPIGRKDVTAILEKLKNQGKTIFLSTHILNDIERLCDRVGILHKGKLAVEGSLSQLLSDAGGQGVEWTLNGGDKGGDSHGYGGDSHGYGGDSHGNGGDSHGATRPPELQEIIDELLTIAQIEGMGPDSILTLWPKAGVSQDAIIEVLGRSLSKNPHLTESVRRKVADLETLYMKVVKS